MSSEYLQARLDEIRARLEARAAGVWQIVEQSLELVVFVAANDMEPSVSLGFAEATRSVELSSKPLGIVGAAMFGEPSVSIAAELPDDVGSGYWLRQFVAVRSVAVPIFHEGDVIGVISVATTTLDQPVDEIETILTAESAGWFTNP
jgi:hypothetical protein